MKSLKQLQTCSDLDTNWQRQAQQSIRTLSELEQSIQLNESERRGVEHAIAKGFPMAITPYYMSLLDKDDPNCPIRKQVIPTDDETIIHANDLRDPLGEEQHQKTEHIVQRYPDRVLLLISDQCSVYCRFCTRSRMVGQGKGAISANRLQTSFEWLESNPQIREVILSGGDPGFMATNKVVSILKRLAEIAHIETVRFASRVPVTLPQRIDEDFARRLSDSHPGLWFMTHFNHPKELTTQSSSALRILTRAGIPIMNQTVLLRAINDQTETLAQLFRGLVARRVRPYYLLQMDPVNGTNHLRTPLQTGIDIMTELQGRYSGIMIPKFIIDTPNGKGKVNIAPDSLQSYQDGVATLKTFRNEIVKYYDPT